MRAWLRRGVVACALLVGVGAAQAASAQTADLTIVEVDAAQHPQVAVTVAGPSRAGATPTVAVREDGADRPATITDVDTSELEVVLLLDTSGSMSGASLAAARGASERFLSAMPPGTRIAVVGFGTTPRVLAPFSQDREAALAAVQTLRVGGETALYDAVATAAASFSSTRTSPHRAVVLLSDGGDTVSGLSADDAARALAGSGATLHAVELDTSESDPAVLQRLATVSGGTVTSAVATEALDGVYADIAAQLVNRYRITYTSAATGSTVLDISVASGDEQWVAQETVELPEPVAGTPVPGRPGPAARPAPVVAAEPTNRTAMLVAGAVGAFGFLALLVVTVRTPSRRSPRRSLEVWRARHGGTAPGTRRQSTLTGLASSASTVLERGMQRRGMARRLNLALERAGIALRPGEFVVLVGSASLTLATVGGLLFGGPAALALALLIILAAKVALGVMASRRAAAFAEQLPDVLQLLAGSLRAGYGLVQALDSVAREAAAPAGEEFHRLIVESRLGRGLGDALDGMVDRLQSEDWMWVVQAVEINREAGGDLAVVLDNVGQTIREREQLRRQIRALSAEGRLSAIILLALPFVVAGLMSLKSPDYFLELFTSGTVGHVLIAIGIVLMTVGSLWIKRIVRLVF